MDDYRIRVRVFVGVVLTVLGVLVLRLAYLQLVDTKAYVGASRSNAIRNQRVLPARGGLYDRNNILMVDNEPTYTLTLTPRYFDKSRIGMLARLLSVPDSLVEVRLQEAIRWSAFKPSPLLQEVSFEVLSRVLENQYLLPGVSYEVTQKRRYLTRAHAAHGLGYVREISRQELEQLRDQGYRPGDLMGQAGLERFYEQDLRGRLGSAFKIVNVHGLEVKSYLDGGEDVPPSSGKDLYLSLDAHVQALAESLLVNKRGAAVALDPNTGEIIAVVSKPDYDPAFFSQPFNPEQWHYLTRSLETPMFNRATMSGMPPGSTWKPFMALMALQEGLITDKTIITCRGGVQVGSRFYKCHGGAHGPIDVRTAIQKSCNSFFYTVMMRANVDMFGRWGRLFGFGQEIPMDIREQKPGLMPDSAYFNRTFGKGRWTAGSTVILGIGQGNMVVTPMQLARYIGAVSNGGILYPPHLVRAMVQPETGERIFPNLPPPDRVPVAPEHFQVVREGMRRVMEAGTGARLQIPGITSGGKTGTAQAPAGREDHSVFVMFAPYDHPQIAIAVMVENGGFGATQAAPIASLMAEQYLTGKISKGREPLVQRVRTFSSEPLK